MVLLSQAQKGTTTPSYACAIWRACLPPRETGIRVQQLRAAQAGLSSGGGHPGVPGTWLAQQQEDKLLLPPVPRSALRPVSLASAPWSALLTLLSLGQCLQGAQAVTSAWNPIVFWA